MPSIRVYLETYGCQMNKLDSENVRAILDRSGFLTALTPDDADVVLLNTCGVRDNAEQRIRGRLGELHSLKRANPDLVFGVIGCMAQRLGRKLISRDVRLVAGPDVYRRLPELIARAFEEPALDDDLAAGETYQDIDPVRESDMSAWVAVSRGCDNFCSYCIVPYTRGRERSIPAESVLGQVDHLAAGGWREVTLLGQNVNSYRDGEVSFAVLLDRVARAGIPWVRFLTSHPKDLGEDILGVMAEHETVCPHLHLPLQSGSDRVLRAMNRGYTMERYRAIVENARRIVPGISITTDLLFGFPGETDEDVQDTLQVMEDVGFEFAFLYRYSEREGTAACDFPKSVPVEKRIERLEEAIRLQNRITRTANARRIGSRVPVLLKGRSKDAAGWYGFSDTGIPTVVRGEGDMAAGTLVMVTVTGTTGASLVGKVE